jgi:hypothetical protein
VLLGSVGNFKRGSQASGAQMFGKHVPKVGCGTLVSSSLSFVLFFGNRVLLCSIKEILQISFGKFRRRRRI